LHGINELPEHLNTSSRAPATLSNGIQDEGDRGVFFCEASGLSTDAPSFKHAREIERGGVEA
jgi:hypothetical protein